MAPRLTLSWRFVRKVNVNNSIAPSKYNRGFYCIRILFSEKLGGASFGSQISERSETNFSKINLGFPGGIKNLNTSLLLMIHGKGHAAGNRGLVSHSRVEEGTCENSDKRLRIKPEKSRGNVRDNKRGDFAVSQF